MGKEQDKGGHAFPQYAAKPSPGGGIHYDVSGGMSLRDWLAGQVIQAIIHTDGPGILGGASEESHPGVNSLEARRRAIWAYRIADAMIITSKEPTP